MSMAKESSTFTAEAFAIRTALKIIYNDVSNKNKDIIILSDAKSVLEAIDNNQLNVYHNKYVVEIKEMKISRELGKRVIYVWIPAHVGIQGNEMADKLAKEATGEKEDPSITVPIGDFRKIFKLATWNMTQDILVREAQFKGKFYYENYYDGRKKKPWFSGINVERYYITIINRLRANHYNLGDSLERKGYIDSARCECGNEKESLEHVLWQCNIYDEERCRLDHELRQRGITTEIDIKKVIKEEDCLTFTCIYNFIKKIGKII